MLQGQKKSIHGCTPLELAPSWALTAVREFANKSAASAASPDYVKFQAVNKSAASAASLSRRPRWRPTGSRLFFVIFGRASGQKISKNHQNLGQRLEKNVLKKKKTHFPSFFAGPGPRPGPGPPGPRPRACEEGWKIQKSGKKYVRTNHKIDKFCICVRFIWELTDDSLAGGRRARLGSHGIPGGYASSRLDHGLKA